MKLLFRSMLALLALTSLPALADDAALAQKRDAKLAEPWLKKAPWFTDFDKAREEAKKGDKPIFAYFSRSYSP